MEHALLPPSSASRWVPCPGSVTLEAMFPENDADKEKAAEGDMAHLVCHTMLAGKPLPDGATDEMVEGAEMYCEDIETVVKASGPGVRPNIEYRLDKTNRMLFDPNNWGTPDCTVNAIPHNKFYAWDYKFGHRYVDVFENLQLINYTILSLCNDLSGKIPEGIECHLRIVQPRSYHPDGPIREWVVMSDDLWSYRTVLAESGKIALAPNPPCKTNSECRDCRARHACPTLQAAGYLAVEASGKAIPFDMPVEAVGRELALMQKAAELLKARIDGLENEVLGNIKRGVPVTGWMTKQGTGRKKWDKPLEEIVALGQMMGVDVSKPDAITPTQAIKAGIPAAVVDSYSTVPLGEVKLVRDNGAQARKVFQGPAK